MWTAILWSVVGWLSFAAYAGHSACDYATRDVYALHLSPGARPGELASALGLIYQGPLGELKDHHLFCSEQQPDDIVKSAVQEHRRRKRKRTVDTDTHILDTVLFSQKQKPRRRLHKRLALPWAPGSSWAVAREDGPVDGIAMQSEIARSLDIKDPIFRDQWHLFNPIQIGHDVNVTGLWREGITGKNVVVAIVDDGLDMDSQDLKQNYFAEGSYDFNDHGLEPRPRLSDDRHGTRCAGEIAAVKNNVCGVGVAWDAKVAGIRILSKEIPDADEAVALNYAYQSNHIYSCSWGPPDDGAAMDAPGILIRRAILNGVQNGRGGKGSVFVFASGNGAANEDNCNFDGYTNSIYSITVGAIDRKGLHPYYSELCSATMVVTYSSGSGDAIVSSVIYLSISSALD
jgi:kexin